MNNSSYFIIFWIQIIQNMHAEWYANNKRKGEKHLKSVENYIDEKNTENGPKKVFF